MNGPAHAKLAAARTRLILEHPFIGALVMHLPLKAVEAERCGTFGSDARRFFFFNADYIAGLDLSQTQFILAHEALHCALTHFARREHRAIARWDLACDHAVNLLLIDEGLSPAPGAVFDRAFSGLSAEEIYPLIPLHAPERSFDEHGLESEGDLSREVERSGAAREALKREWRSRAVMAAQQARLAGRLPASWARLVDSLVAPVKPWRERLAHFLLATAREDWSFERPSRRGEGDALLPRPFSRTVELHVAIDTSGSIDAAQLQAFSAELDALRSQLAARLTVFACDERLDSSCPWRFDALEPARLPDAVGGGSGTSFVPVFEWIASHGERPNVLLYFTDGEGECPTGPPPYPVLWALTGRTSMPWGECIELDARIAA